MMETMVLVCLSLFGFHMLLHLLLLHLLLLPLLPVHMTLLLWGMHPPLPPSPPELLLDMAGSRIFLLGASRLSSLCAAPMTPLSMRLNSR
jgi:hypothetical protein